MEPPAPAPPAPSFNTVVLPAAPLALMVPLPEIEFCDINIMIPPPVAPLLDRPLFGVPVPLLLVPAPPPPPITNLELDAWAKMAPGRPPAARSEFQEFPPLPPRPPLLPPPPPVFSSLPPVGSPSLPPPPALPGAPLA